MSTEPIYPKPPQNNGKVLAGLILLAVGSMLLLRQFDFFFFPHWIFSWPMLLIVIGCFNGAKQNFKNPGALIMILIGVIFLSGRISPFIDLSNFTFPIVIIAVGIWLMIRRDHVNRRWGNADWKAKHAQFDSSAFVPEADYRVKTEEEEAAQPTPEPDTNSSYTKSSYSGDDVLDSVSVFGGVKKVILSKDFKGGEIVNIFGGAEVDFSQADIKGTVIVEITQIFGGVKLVVPPHWSVTSDIAAVFASVDDKRFGKFGSKGPLNPEKLLVLKGTSIFAGIDVRSF